MQTSNRLLAVVVVTLSAVPVAQAAPDIWGLKPGKIELQSAGALAFGPEGILFVGDAKGGSIYAIHTGDTKADSPAKTEIADLSSSLAKLLGAEDVKVNDLAVNPETGSTFLSLAVGKPAKPAIVKVSTEGKLTAVPLDAPHSKATLADAPESQVTRRGDVRDDSITDLAFSNGKLLVSGLAKGKASSTVRELVFPFQEGATATNIEIYHAAHGRVEDNAPVRTFVSMTIDGEPTLLAGFTCTPLVSFPIKAVTSGEKVRGTTVAELGNRNRPLDMIVYEKEGKSYVLMSNSARGVMKVSLANIKQNPGLTEHVEGGGTAGQPFETIKDLTGVEQLDRLDDTHAVIIARSATGSLDLKTIDLP
jgi:hypothetical protein